MNGQSLRETSAETFQIMNTNLARPSDRENKSDLRRQEKSRQIIDAATDVFLEDGYSAASIDRIVERAGVSKRTLYNYYQSKEEIFIDVIHKQLNAFYSSVESHSHQPQTLAEQLMQIGIGLLTISNEPKTLALFRNIAAEAQRFPKLAHQFLDESCEKVIAGLAEIFAREGEQAGLHITDTHEASEHFLDMLGGAAYNRVVFGTAPPMKAKAIKARAEQAIRYFFKAYQH